MRHSWQSAVALPLILLGLAALCQGTSAPPYKCFGFLNPAKGTIEPQTDVVLEVGSSYEAYCLFNPEEVDVDSVYFKTSGSDERIIPHTVMNNSAIKVQVTHNEATKYYLRCLTGNDSFICRRAVVVGYKPQDVENFTCLSMNWQSLNCSWDVPENPVAVSYTLTYVIEGFTPPSECPHKEDGKNWCYWHGSDFRSGRQNWTMIFSAENNLTSDPVEFRHHVDVFASVIPNKAKKFFVDVLGPRKVILKWHLPHPIDVFVDGNVRQEVKYRIKPFRNMLQNSPWILVDLWEVTPTRFQRIERNKTISGLHPYVEYEFSVRLHTGTGPIREEMWSKPALVTKRTESTRPAVAPRTTQGMFEVEETKLHRDVYVSWQTVDPLHENGPDFTYEVRIFDASNESPVASPLTTEHGYAKFPSLENSITYRFEIRPKNHEGYPEEPDVKSEVIVPKKEALLGIPDYFKVIAYPVNDTTTYMARWRHANRNVKSLTLYWCKQTAYENRCESKITWEIINEPNRYVKNLTGYDNSSRYIFGISVNSHNSSSGIKWSGCIARHGVQQPALEKFNYTYVSSTEVTLKWDHDCKAVAAQPYAFNISYCIAEDEKDCSESEMYVKVDGESTVQHTVRNLHPYTEYIFYIATISDQGLGKWTTPIHVKTKPSKPSGPPQNIRDISKGRTWIELTWDPPLKSKQNGEIIFYRIKYKVKSSLSLVPINENDLVHNFTNLDPFTEYHFEVVPCTRVSEASACGSHAAEIDVKTKIGAPGKMDSIEYDSPWLKWDHEECNGPNCAYELNYTINGTMSSYNTSINQTSISLRDLNISCPVKQGDIQISIRAVGTDEEGHRLFGPRKEKKIPCPSKGSYLMLLPFSVSNQYNTNFNFIGVLGTFPVYVSNRNPRLHTLHNGVESLTYGNTQKLRMPTLPNSHSVSSIESYQHSVVHINNKQIPVDDFSNQQLGSDVGNERQRSLFDDGVNSRNEPLDSTTDFSQGHLQGNWRWALFTRQGNTVLFPEQASLETRLPSDVKFSFPFTLSNAAGPTISDEVRFYNSGSQNDDLHRRENVSVDSSVNQNADKEPSTNLNQIADREPSTNSNQSADREPFTNSNQSADTELSTNSNQIADTEPSTNSNHNESTVSKHKTVTDQNNQKILCPLLELMKAEGVQVSLNTSDKNFELKITGQGNFSRLLHNVYLSHQNHDRVESELPSENTGHEMEDNDPRTTSERLMNTQELNQQDPSYIANLNISSSYKKHETNLTQQNYAHNTSLNHSVTYEEVLQRQPFTSENSNFMTLDLPADGNNEDQRTPSFIDSVENRSPASGLPFNYVSPNSQSDNFTNNNTLLSRQNGSSLSVNITKRSNIPDFVESRNSLNSSENSINLFSEPSGPDSIHTSVGSRVQTNHTVIIDSEPDNLNKHRSRRDISMVQVIFRKISQRSQVPLLDFMQGRYQIKSDSKVLNIPNELPLNDMGISQRREDSQNTESVRNHRQRTMQMDEESEQDSDNISQEYKDTEVKPVVTELLHARTSSSYS